METAIELETTSGKILQQLEKLSRMKVKSIQSPKGADERRLRRVAVWACHEIYGLEKKTIQEKFGIESLQSVHRIISQKKLDEEEYNLRRELQKTII